MTVMEPSDVVGYYYESKSEYEVLAIDNAELGGNYTMI